MAVPPCALFGAGHVGGRGDVPGPARLGSAQRSMADAASQVLLGSGLTALSQPLMYVKVLVQVGYEPLPPTLGRNMFGRQVYQLPGLFAYAKHIMKIDGRAGLFKGLTPRLCSGAIGTIVHSQVLQRYQEADQEEEPGPSLKEPLSSLEQVIKEIGGDWTLNKVNASENETSREMVARSAATLVTHPFHVITLRCMVQFIGRETKYSGIFSPFVTIYREEGILGFFAGLVPRLLGDVLSLWLCNMLAYLINTYALENGVSTMSEMKSYSQAVTGFFASMLTYPFVLVSNLMAINNCGLAGGLPPYAPNYSSWLDCWSQLLKEGNMSRGNSLFFRKVPAGKLYVWEEKRFR
ncbi:mitochondrial carrier homolog 2 isoform X2 [Mauremys reevesii]|uniref:mitochondrial carrier homolog 2 isoform X2 n=1 Tax=Mauremys reevesii TaxID=260615 RepID=UPI00193F7648|nr:mitochondrial carrier homolog 2 isoform X2 [Mauremys reevesii]